MGRDLIGLLVTQGGWMVFAATLASRLGLPVPGAPFVVVAGAMVALGRLPIAGVLLACVVANVVGDGVWFLIGRRQGYRILRLLCRLSISPDSCVTQSERFIGRWGGASLLAAKFLPGVSVVAPPVAGALGMSVASFLAWEAAGGLVWALVFLALGALFANQVDALLSALSAMGVAAGLALVAAFGAWLAWRHWKRRRFLRSVGSARITVDELHALLLEGHEPVILDVRSSTGRALDPRRIPGARPFEVDAVEDLIDALPDDREIVVYCDCPNEASAAVVAQRIAARGRIRVRALLGGIDAWAAAGHPVSRHADAPAAEETAEAPATV
jgi:membrane protein DedA with SNARE-associated domain/rhodanese-related sulfurtransferase